MVSTQSLLITLTIVSVTCAIAVLLARRWQLLLVPAWLAGIGWSAAMLVAFYFVQSAWPPIPWTVAALDAEPWESVVYPLMAVCIVWPLIIERVKPWPAVGLLTAMGLSCLPLLAALCQSERFASLHIGNTPWALSTLLAIGINWIAMERLQASGAGRWSLLIVVGQSMTVAALIMTCYGRFGEWATLTGIALGGVALARICISNPLATWLTSLALPALALNAILIMHIREYRSVPLPFWFPALPFLLPTLVATVDAAWASRLYPIIRVIVAGMVTIVLAAATIAIILAVNGPAEEW